MRRSTRRWDPWRELAQLQSDVNRLLQGGWRAGPRRPEVPAVNVWQDAESVVLVAELPGINPDELDIVVHGNTVTIRGRRSVDPLKEGESYVRRERFAADFARTVEVPFEVDPAKAEATYERGVLMLRLHRPEEQKPKKIVIRKG